MYVVLHSVPGLLGIWNSHLYVVLHTVPGLVLGVKK